MEKEKSQVMTYVLIGGAILVGVLVLKMSGGKSSGASGIFGGSPAKSSSSGWAGLGEGFGKFLGGFGNWLGKSDESGGEYTPNITRGDDVRV